MPQGGLFWNSGLAKITVRTLRKSSIPLSRTESAVAAIMATLAELRPCTSPMMQRCAARSANCW